MNYIASIQAPLTGADTRPDHLAQLASDLQPVLIALQSWATYDFTQAIFDDTLPVPDLNPSMSPFGSPAAWTCPTPRR